MMIMMMTTKFIFLLICFGYLFTSIYGLDNGLARRPPMGWLSWMRFACIIDCKTYPDDCIDENLYRNMIDRIVEDGYLEAGYKYVNIDDCWMSMQRDPKTLRLLPNQTRFPSGIDELAKYAHSKNVLLGIYEDVGTETCGGYPGTYFNSIDHTFIDAETFSDWSIDSLKLDGCFAKNDTYNFTYPEYSYALANVEHPILYACSWPAYLANITDETYADIRQYCNLWRNFGDIVDSYESIFEIIKYYGENNEQFREYHGPGGWFDPDMLIIGNNGLSLEQSKTQMAFWCMWSAPLLMSNDLRSIRPEMKEILLNKELIAIDQDPLGIMASLVIQKHNWSIQVWTKKLSPINNDHDHYRLNPWAILYFYGNQLGPDQYMSYKLSSIIPELNETISYDVYDLFAKDTNHSFIGTLKPQQYLRLLVPTAGSVRLVKLIPKI
uniref:Alpha-galactosidase n=1 Tax=Dermatophagoides pteronyssinus TaxID=6956 RepID=A0A6P6XY44_DERPT|nr:alpha-N-acetylgalactosaminidase-like [Dermatophagoides pteronyssinus]